MLLILCGGSLRAQSNAQRAADLLAPPKSSRGDLPAPSTSAGDFPALPPDPYQDQLPPLPPLEEELWKHGGSHIYAPEGDRWNWPQYPTAPYEVLRSPESQQRPEPLVIGGEYVGTGPIESFQTPLSPYAWSPQLVGYGNLRLFGFALQENRVRRDAVGLQWEVELDLKLTATERFHVQFRPFGRGDSGGSYYAINGNDLQANLSLEPSRYWFEGELHSFLGWERDPTSAAAFHLAVGKMPLQLHNSLLANDEVLGVILSRNTIPLGPLSNLNAQLFAVWNDLQAFEDNDGRGVGVHLSADYQRVFYEATYAYANHADVSADAHLLALSRTQLLGPYALAGRAMTRWSDSGGSGQLFVLESNWTRYVDSKPLGIEYGVAYCNAFYASDNWRSLGGGNFNRLNLSFEANPLTRLAAGGSGVETWGAVLGVQLFRDHENESWIPELAWENRGGEAVWGMGLRWQRKSGPRSYWEASGVVNFSDDSRYDRDGLFLSKVLAF